MALSFTNWKKGPVSPAHYALGMWAWALHRISGIIIALYSLAHITVLSSVLLGTGSFDSVMELLSRPFALWLELGLLAAIIVHGLNGIRLILFDLGIATKYQKEIFVFNMVVGAFIFIVVFFKVLSYITEGL